MYGKVPTVAGVSVLPATGNSKPLLIVALSLIAGGVATMVVAAILARKSRSEAVAAN